MKKIITLFLFATLVASVGWAADITVSKTMNEIVSANDYTVSSGSDVTCYTSFSLDNNITISTTGKPNCGSFWGTTTIDWRLYQNKNGNVIVSATSDYILKSVKFTFSVSNNGTLLNNNGGALISNESVSITGNSVTFTVGNSGSATNGQVKVTAISVTYASELPPIEIHKATGISAFKSMGSGSMVELYLPDGYNARITHVERNSNGTVDAYVRDNTGAIRMTGLSPNRPMAYNQHLAGYITGKYSVGSDGVPQFEPDEDLTNTAFLVIADPVTEHDTKPVSISSDEIDSYLGDWVAINDVAEGDITVNNNKFDLDYYTDHLYNGAVIDIHAIVANGTLYPVDDLDHYPITFVVDAQKDFVSPTSDIANAQVRLKRNLSSGAWNLLTVPFEIEDFEGEVLEYAGVSLGQVGSYNYQGQTYPIYSGVMHFDDYYGTLQPGMPYMVKPYSSQQEMTLNGVTLRNAAARTVTWSLAQQNAPGINLMANELPAYVGDYSLVGTYSPMTLPKDESTVKLIDNNTLSWTSLIDDTEIAGTEAYITIPEGAGVKLDLGGDDVVTAITNIRLDNNAPQETVIYNILGIRLDRPLGELPPGIYIVNGKKIVKR